MSIDLGEVSRPVENIVRGDFDMGNLMKTSGGANDHSVLRPTCIVGMDFGLCAPSDELFYIHVYLNCGGGVSHCFNALVYAGDELRIGERKVPWANGLKFLVFSFGDEEYEIS